MTNPRLTDAEFERVRADLAELPPGINVAAVDVGTLRSLVAEVDRARKKIKGLQEECDRYAIRAYERFRADQSGEGQP
jgi:hypothetical protein